jgi:hypothetical protein
VYGEDTLYADSPAHLAHGDGFLDAGAPAGDDDALEDLDSLLVAFDDSDMDPDRIPRLENGKIIAKLFGFDLS